MGCIDFLNWEVLILLMLAEDLNDLIGVYSNASYETILWASDESILVEFNHGVDGVGMPLYSILTVSKPIPLEQQYDPLTGITGHKLAILHDLDPH